jgi:hypothetical protein
MSAPSQPADDDPRPEHPTTRPTEPDRFTSKLRLRMVENAAGPDRATVHPPGLTGIERMETWLSVDASAVVDLSAWR